MSLFSRDDGQPAPRARSLPLLPLRDIIVFPHMVVPLFVGRPKSIAALEEAMGGDKAILLCAQKKAKTNEPTPDDIFAVGTVGSIIQLLRLPDGTVKVLVEGKKRAKVLQVLGGREMPGFAVELADFAKREAACEVRHDLGPVLTGRGSSTRFPPTRAMSQPKNL